MNDFLLQYEHQNELRPTLGHPNQQPELDRLCEKENTRKEEYLACVEKNSEALQVANVVVNILDILLKELTNNIEFANVAY